MNYIMNIKISTHTKRVLTTPERKQRIWSWMSVRLRYENIALKYRQRNAEKFRIVLDDLPVIRIVARIHH